MNGSIRLKKGIVALMVYLGIGIGLVRTSAAFESGGGESKAANSGYLQNHGSGFDNAGSTGSPTYDTGSFRGFNTNSRYGSTPDYSGNSSYDNGGQSNNQPQTGGNYTQQAPAQKFVAPNQQNSTSGYNNQPYNAGMPSNSAPPAGYAGQGGGYGSQGYSTAPSGYASPPVGYGGPGYGAPPVGYGGPGYGAPPVGYGGPGYGAPPVGYGGPGYGAPPVGYGGPGYGAPPVGYGGPGYGAPPVGYGGPGYGGYGDQGYYDGPHSRSDNNRGPFGGMPGPMRSMPNPMQMFGGGNRD